jgi:two-component system chemotaxis response regulator CheY
LQDDFVSKQFNIMLVIDSQADRKAIVDLLKNTFKIKNVMQTHTPSNAMNMLKTCEPLQMVICDTDLPQITGFDFIKKAKTQKSAANAKFIMTSTRKDREILLQAASLGVKDYIVRPINPATLRNKLTKHFKRTAMRANERVAFFEAYAVRITLGQQEYKGSLLDLSLGGCLAKTQLFDKGASIYNKAKVTIDSKLGPLMLEAELVRMESYNEDPERKTQQSAFKFTNIDKIVAAKLSEIIAQSKSKSG